VAEKRRERTRRGEHMIKECGREGIGEDSAGLKE